MDDYTAQEHETAKKKQVASDQVYIRITKETKKHEKQKEISAKRRQFIIGLKLSKTSRFKF